MASFQCVSVVGLSVERFLTAAFLQGPPLDTATTTARLVRTEDFDPKNLVLIPKPFLSLFPYRVDVNKVTRAGWSAVGSLDGVAHLPLDLHFLMSAWAQDAGQELRILGRAMQALETTPILGGPLLLSSGGFAANESIQIVHEDVSTEAVMRVFDSLPTDYKLSVPYLARLSRIDGRREETIPVPPALAVVVGKTPSVTPP